MGSLSLQDARSAGNQTSANTQVNVHPVERTGSAILGGGMVSYGLGRGTPGGWLLAIAGGGLLYRGLSGNCMGYRLMGVSTAGQVAAGSHAMDAEHTLVIDREAEELFDTWRHFKGLPDFMSHLVRVEELDEQRSRWSAKGPLGTTITWQAEITEERTNELIAWKSIEGSAVESTGWVKFEPTGEDNATRVTVHFRYAPPAGAAGALLSQMLGADPERQMQHDLSRFKAIMENERSRATVKAGSHGLSGPQRGGLGR